MSESFSEPWKTEQDARLAAMDMALKVACEERDALKTALEAAKPLVKARILQIEQGGYRVDDAYEVLDKIEAALAGKSVPK